MTHRVRVSVCAMTGATDVDACVAGGADAVGVLVGVRHKAEDAVTLDVAATLLTSVPPYIGRYVVTHALDPEELVRIAHALPIDTLQVHDHAEPEAIAAVRQKLPGLRVLKAVHIRSDHPSRWDQYARVSDGFVLDSVDPMADRIGGTGKTHDWAMSATIAQASPVPVVLAGGLTPRNVADAVSVVRPWAVNVNSGVESEGHKDVARVRALVEGANQCLPSTSG